MTLNPPLLIRSPQDFFNHKEAIQAQISYTFKQDTLLLQAFTHSSFLNEWNPQIKDPKKHLICNERLEFLGDSVLNHLISDYLFRNYTNSTEGELTHLRSRLVDSKICTQYLQTLKLEPYLIMGKGLYLHSQKNFQSIWANLFESLLGAIYLDSNIDECQKNFFHHFSEDIHKICENPERNSKAELQDLCQKFHKLTPDYQTLRTQGPEHKKIFEVCVILKEKSIGYGTGFSKKQAQQMAAKEALSQFEGT